MKKLVMGLAALAALSACAEGGRDAFLVQQAVSEMQRVSGQVDSLQNNQEALARRVAAIEGKAGSSAEVANLRADVAALRAQVDALKRAQEAMRAEIVADLTKRIGKIMKDTPPPPPPKPREREEVVYSGPYLEYPVAPGDTLSLIAETFGTKVETIRKMNGLRGDNLRVGQKLKLPKSEAPEKKSAAPAKKARK